MLLRLTVQLGQVLSQVTLLLLLVVVMCVIVALGRVVLGIIVSREGRFSAVSCIADRGCRPAHIGSAMMEGTLLPTTGVIVPGAGAHP